MAMLLLTDARIVDGTADQPSAPVNVLIEGGTIRGGPGPKVKSAASARARAGPAAR